MSWPTVRLGDVCYEVRERVSVSGVDLENYITTDNMLKGCAGVRIAESLPPSGSLVKFQPGDVLTSNIRPYLKKSWLSDRVGGCSNDVIVYRPKDNQLSSRYLYSVLSSDTFFDYSMRNVSGAKMPRGKRDWLEMFEFPLPPLAEQKRIVEKLGKELARVDAMKAKFERMKESAEQYFKSALAEAFENVEGETVNLGDVCENLDSKRIPITKADRKSGNYPYYGASGIVDYVDGYLFDGEYLLVSEDGANLLARSTPIAFSVSGKIWVNNHAHILQFSDAASQKFVEFYFASIDISQLVTGAAQPKLTQAALNSVSLPFPPLPIQREIIARLEVAKSRTERIAAKARKGVEACAQMRKALLAEAFA